ncbi:hypothetical protein BD560DRAFT_399443 [Blakeslea trispora]|nr:hypothetical protein BD560DRAFT_399443 [Blakeslea trispora]
MVFSYLIFIALATASTVQSTSLARSHHTCALLDRKLFCFFGESSENSTKSIHSNEILSLDLSSASGKSITQLEHEWTIVKSDANGVDIAPRLWSQSADLGDGRRVLFNGGYSATAERLTDPTIIYDAVENKWTKHDPYTEPPYGPRQIYFGSAVRVPGKGIAFYGGYEEFINPSWTTPSLNVSLFNFAEDRSRTIGFTKVTYFNTKNAWYTPVTAYGWTAAFLAHQKSIYDPIHHRILFMGGQARLNEQEKYTNVLQAFSFSSAWSFDTINNTWNTTELTGNYPKIGRNFHTLTLAPNTNKDIILFGGEDFGGKNDGKASKDYCYTLSLETYKWKKVKIRAPRHTALARTRHSATLVSNNTLLITWGVDAHKTSLTSMLILDISNPYAITLSDTYSVSI